MKPKIPIILIMAAVLVNGCVGKEQQEVGKEVSAGSLEVSNTTRAGQLAGNEIWSDQINITGDILVPEGITLTILPGTRVIISAHKDNRNLFGQGECNGIKNFDLLTGIPKEDIFNCGVHKGEPYRDEANHISIIIRGILKAVGTEEDRIVFKSDSLNPTIYDWNRLEIHSGILSYADVQNYRILETRGDNVEISHNNLKNIGECGICANSQAKILFNAISDAGHELIDMHDSSPVIQNNQLGPNPDKSGITIDGGLPQIADNTIRGCGSGISLLKQPVGPAFEENVLQNNTFIGNSSGIWHTY